ncbi:hypothetical protein AU468_09890 [Alkalispirochaeta sphaeroplastigenens]|uniref:Tripartite ATP-independent periplasmic transporters DctQ component domain-containing protein n=1 Tax=Alkalispirochaeta sphaeroplastigenens TaxID=1187066 RepID=A0A2S4JKC7_9SPIO|nr:TRAP transporter small permease [Alkalispirochaeta sphaeroplastigenens]POR00004.1 hypothetical protein AU468_09890 [Alkalispirochaeta sphaeroplastigenens]
MHRTLRRAEEALAVFLFSVILLLILWQIISRYILGVPVPWTDELSRLLFVYMGVLGAHLAQRDKIHVRIDMILSCLAPRALRVVEILFNLIILACCIFLIRQGMILAARKAVIYMITINVSSWFLYIPLSILGALVSLEVSLQTWGLLRQSGGPGEADRC